MTPGPTDKQAAVYAALVEGGSATVRELADRLEGDEHRAERFSDAEVRGLLERLEADGRVEQYGEGPVRYRPAR